MKRSFAAFILTIGAFTVVGCASPGNPPADTSPPRIEHVHSITGDPRSEGVLLGTHNGIFTVTLGGKVNGPVGGNDFDAMGFTLLGDAFIASGHPGPETPEQLGSPNLGIIRSDDQGENWEPVSMNGVEDFHVLTASTDGTLYGVGSSEQVLLRSSDAGLTWEKGARIEAVDVTKANESVYALTKDGLQQSADDGDTFVPVAEAPLFYAIEVKSNGALVGVDVEGTLWQNDAQGDWVQIAQAEGTVQALGIALNDAPVWVDDRGVVELATDEVRVIAGNG